MTTSPEDLPNERAEPPSELPASQADSPDEPMQPPVKRRWQERLIDGLQDFLHRILQQM